MDEVRAKALFLTKGLEATASNLERIAREVGPEAARWGFLQWELRARAKAKFARADEMLFTREALEQATHERVAAYHASLFPPGAAVVDMTCGIGADLIALGRRGDAAGYDLDPERADYARHNLAVHGLAADVRVGDSLAPAASAEYAFADPSRRVDGQRTRNPSEFLPDPRLVAASMARMKLGLIKLSPMMDDALLESLGPGLAFVSFGGECREALVWCGQEARSGRVAIRIEDGQEMPAGPGPREASTPGRYVFEADPAAIRAHCLGVLAASHGLLALGNSNGYLTGESYVRSPWLRPFRVLHDGPADLRKTSAALREMGAGTPEIKQRGVKEDVARLRKALAGSGLRSVAVMLWPLGKSVRHTVVEAAELSLTPWSGPSGGAIRPC